MKFLLNIWWMKQIFLGTKKTQNSYITWPREVADTDAGHDQPACGLSGLMYISDQ